MLPGLKKRVVNLHDVLMYVAIARKHVRLMILLLSFCWLGAVVFYVYSRPIYTSKSLIKTDIIDRNRTAEAAFNEKGGRIIGIIIELQQPHIVQRAAARLGVKASARDIQEHYVKKIVPRRNSENNIEVDVYTYSYDWAERWVPTLVREYLDYKEQRRKIEFDQREENYETDRKRLLDMIAAERKLNSKSLAETELQRKTIDLETLSAIPGQLVATKRKLAALRRAQVQLVNPDLDTIERLSIMSSLTEDMKEGTVIPAIQNTLIVPSAGSVNGGTTPLNQELPAARVEQAPSTVITPDIANESNWRGIVQENNVLEAKKADLLRTLQPGHKKVLEIQELLDVARQRLDAAEKTALDRFKLTFTELTQRHAELERDYPKYQEALNKLGDAQDIQGVDAGSMRKWANQLRAEKLKLEDNEFAMIRERIKVEFGGVMGRNENPVSPNRFQLLMYATVLGLMLAIGVPFLIEYLDHTLSNMEEVEAAFQLRGLGIIPKLGTSDEQNSLLDRESAKESNLLENFRVIRTNLLSMGSVTKPPHVIIVTSAMPKEGKTFVSSNLALSFAQTGAKTLLMDTDLRRGRLHRLFGYRKQPGLSGVLMDQVSLDEAIRPTPCENLFMLSAGQHLETGTELLGSKKFLKILEELKGRFDRIVMDTPPVLGLSETSILQNHVDGVLFVIWSGQTPIKSVKAAIEILQANGANFYGFVLNRLDLSATANYYQYYYYSHDYYYQYTPRSLENR
jgi:polysaccharide biosynthesis transport protein